MPSGRVKWGGPWLGRQPSGDRTEASPADQPDQQRTQLVWGSEGIQKRSAVPAPAAGLAQAPRSSPLNFRIGRSTLGFQLCHWSSPSSPKTLGSGNAGQATNRGPRGASRPELLTREPGSSASEIQGNRQRGMVKELSEGYKVDVLPKVDHMGCFFIQTTSPDAAGPYP
ncbi:hypothetical protein VTJ04DRAFT_1914 [Mycothermus thermophilus]|uniref:uncharacterized protein n=1 Tax=Humicola insolens TaxID=85995 RepID=UPI0037427639